MSEKIIFQLEELHKFYGLSEVLKGITIKSNRFGVEPEITAKVARGGWRVYEVGISYSGRSYEEGKKITWKDGLQAMYCIFRFAMFD